MPDPPTSLAAFQKQVRAKRAELGLHQGQVATNIGVSQAAISQFELGKSPLSSGRMEALCRLLDLPPPVDLLKGGAALLVLKYCPKHDCILSYPYFTSGRQLFRPSLTRTDADRKSYCPCCGSLLVSCCNNKDCRAPIVPNYSYCPECGLRYIPEEGNLTRADIATQNQDRENFLELFQIREFRHAKVPVGESNGATPIPNEEAVEGD